MSGIKVRVLFLSSLMALVAAGCAPVPKQAQQTSEIICEPAGNSSLVGNWLGERSQAGVAGSLQVWVHLRPNGTMTYAERLQRKGKPPQSMRETGCWQDNAASGELVLRTLQSNGAWVEADDPIYVNRFPVSLQGSDQLKLGEGQNAFLLKRMPNDYLLPF